MSSGLKTRISTPFLPPFTVLSYVGAEPWSCCLLWPREDSDHRGPCLDPQLHGFCFLLTPLLVIQGSVEASNVKPAVIEITSRLLRVRSQPQGISDECSAHTVLSPALCPLSRVHGVVMYALVLLEGTGGQMTASQDSLYLLDLSIMPVGQLALWEILTIGAFREPMVTHLGSQGSCAVENIVLG